VSEAALYRHFASKAQMFEGLIEFIESSVFGLINQIAEREERGVDQAHAILQMLLGFAANNPGMTRVLIGDALVGEDERLQLRMNQFYDKVELACKGAAPGRHPGPRREADVAARASLLVSYVTGRWHRYAKSGFRRTRPKARRCNCRCCWRPDLPADHEYRTVCTARRCQRGRPAQARSRLYTGHAGTLAASDAAGWPQCWKTCRRPGARPVRGAAAQL
jgi:TetR/AcrR family transcriptional regulator